MQDIDMTNEDCIQHHICKEFTSEICHLLKFIKVLIRKIFTYDELTKIIKNTKTSYIPLEAAGT